MSPYARKWERMRLIELVDTSRDITIWLLLSSLDSCMTAHWISGDNFRPRRMSAKQRWALDQCSSLVLTCTRDPEALKFRDKKSFNFGHRMTWDRFSGLVQVERYNFLQIPVRRWGDMDDERWGVFFTNIFPRVNLPEKDSNFCGIEYLLIQFVTAENWKCLLWEKLHCYFFIWFARDRQKKKVKYFVVPT